MLATDSGCYVNLLKIHMSVQITSINRCRNILKNILKKRDFLCSSSEKKSMEAQNVLKAKMHFLGYL